MLSDRMNSMNGQVQSSFRRFTNSLGLDDGGNNTVTLGSRIHNFFESRFGLQRVKYLLFGTLITTFVLYVWLIQDHEDSLLIQLQKSRSSTTSSDSTSSSADNITNNTTGNSTNSQNSTSGTTVIPISHLTDDAATATNQFFTSIFLSLLSWLFLIQILRCIRNMSMVNTNRLRQQRQEEQLEMIQQIAVLTRANQLPGLSTRLRLALLNRDFTGDDYEMLQQLDEQGRLGGGRRSHTGQQGASEFQINRLPLHKITTEELAAQQQQQARSQPPPTVNIEGGLDAGTIASSSSLNHSNQPQPSTTAAKDKEEEVETASNPSMRCNVCLGPYEVGEEVRTLLCLHQFHRQCIDPWLRTQNLCPICKFSIVQPEGEEEEEGQQQHEHRYLDYQEEELAR